MGKTPENDKKELVTTGSNALSDPRFSRLADVPPEIEWFANITNPETRRAYKTDIQDFSSFFGLKHPEEFRLVNRAHAISWRDSLIARELSPATIRRKLSALASLFDYLCDVNAVPSNPIDGVRRPGEDANEGKTAAISDAQARKLLDAPSEKTLKGNRDRAILSTFLFHGLRVAELASLRVRDIQERRGVIHFRIKGKRDKVRFVPVHPATIQLIHSYLEIAGHSEDKAGALFRPVKNNVSNEMRKHLHTNGLRALVRAYGLQVGIPVDAFSPHSLRATSATNALENDADIAKVQEWLGHANVSTTRLYDKRKNRPEESPTFQVSY